MQYITIVSDTYEKALDEAKRKYGDALRVHSRREYTVGGGLFTRRRHKCELTCYLVEPRAGERKAKKEETVTRQDLAEFEKEAQTPDPSRLSEAERLDTAQPARQLEGERRVHDILDLNGIRLKLRDHILDGFEPGDDLDLALGDRIISSVAIDHENQAHPRRYQVFLGPTGSGKTTTLAKIASLYKTVGKDVGIICLDSYRVGAFEQVKAFADAFSIPAVLVKDEDAVLLAKDGMRDKDLVLVDTMGLSPNDIPLNLKLRGLLALFEAADTSYLLTCPATMKTEDMLKQWRHYDQFVKVNSLIVTKLDESQSIGSFLTFAYEAGLPISFCTNGQGVPEDLKKASTLVLMEYLDGFDMHIRPIIGQLT